MIAPGVGIASAQQPGGLGEIPPLMLNVQERGIYSQAEGYLDSHWEVDGPRRGIRFLASILLLFSIMQVRLFLEHCWRDFRAPAAYMLIPQSSRFFVSNIDHVLVSVKGERAGWKTPAAHSTQITTAHRSNC